MTKKNTPIVSVILPTYNRASLLPRAIQSVLNQTYKNFELIIIDDHSNDNTDKVVKEFKDNRVRYIRHKENKGAAAARNTGIRLAKGKYIAFQDSDDEWLPKKLERQIIIFENLSPKYGVVYSGYWRISKEQKTYLPSIDINKKEGNIHKSLLNTSFVPMVTVICRKGYFKKAGLFDEKLPRLQDWELCLRISKRYKFKFIDEPLVVVYHQSTNSISNNIDALIEAYELILEKHKKDYKKNKLILGKRLTILADVYARTGNFKNAKRVYRDALKLNMNIKYILAFVLIILFPSKIYNKILNKFINYEQ